MMAVRERAVKVMAALERRVPCLDDFVGQSWSVWTERTNLTASEVSDGDEYSKNGKKSVETMTLRKEDMSIFGHYPGQDDFYLVVCGHCSQVVKPQAFEKHCEKRHGPLGKLYAHLRSTPPPPQQQRPRHGHPPPSSWSGRNQNVGPPRASPQSPSTPPQFRHSKPPKDGVWHSPSNSGHSESAVFKQPPPIEPTRSSPPPTHRDPPWPHGGPSPNRPSSTERPQSQRGEAASAPVTSGHLRGPKTYKMVPKKECDLDKHCGVLDPERKKVCTRLLTCNIHSIHQRRKVQGRSKNFDQLVAELKMSSKARDRVSQALESSAAPTVSPEPPRDPPVPPLCRRPLMNSPAFRTHTSSESVEEDKPHLEDASTRQHSPLTQTHVSGDESEAEGTDDLADWHSTPWHPKPAALCSFGSHSLGHGVFTFDRRLHHLRSAMSAMVENHLSAHLWNCVFTPCTACGRKCFISRPLIPLLLTEKYLKHQLLTPRVPQLSLQPFLPLLPPFPSIPNRKQEVTIRLLSRLPSTLPTDQARRQTRRVPPPAKLTVSPRTLGAASQRPHLLNSVEPLLSRAPAGPRAHPAVPTNSSCVSGKQSGRPHRTPPLCANGKPLLRSRTLSAQIRTVCLTTRGGPSSAKRHRQPLTDKPTARFHREASLVPNSHHPHGPLRGLTPRAATRPQTLPHTAEEWTQACMAGWPALITRLWGRNGRAVAPLHPPNPTGCPLPLILASIPGKKAKGQGSP
ncbi:ataxin-7-like protein 2a isoform X1 [Carassius gibelio]|uniref:ataxin-7-like protein 2a isoform X1 n=1 Tax=Carassius gibelio TaxID=101364 RepID=UPI002277DF4E|nr:ataxin-7-like protein 2a isoform X1 [Carassius gibelio]